MPVTSPVDLGVVVFYLLAVTVVGCLMSRRTRSAGEFISAGGALPGWVVGLSILGTFVSSISFIANPGKSFAANWNPFVFSLSLPYAALVATIWFVPFFRNSGSYSAYQHLEKRFGAWARIYAVTFNILYHIGRIGTILFGVSLAMSALLNVPVAWIIIGLGVLVIAYTLLGGIEAVIWTDVVQSVILIGGMFICLYLVITGVPGGFMGIIDAASRPDENKLSLGSVACSFSSPTVWTVLLFGFFINLQNFTADQTYVQRYLTAKSEADARRSVWIGAVAYLPISAILFFIGTGLFVFYSNGSAALPPNTKVDAVLPHFIMTQMPTGAAGLLIAAILAAAMSTVDSSLNSSSTLLLCDVRNRFFRNDDGDRSPGAQQIEEQAQLTFLRVMTVVLGIAGIGIGLAMMRVENILDVWWRISGTLSGGTLGLILLARFTKAQGSRGALAGVICGVSLLAAISVLSPSSVPAFASGFIGEIQSWFDPLMGIVVGTITVFVVGSLLSRRSDN